MLKTTLMLPDDLAERIADIARRERRTKQSQTLVLLEGAVNAYEASASRREKERAAR